MVLDPSPPLLIANASASVHDGDIIVAVCCNVLQCVSVCCNVLQCVAVCCSVLQCVAVCFGVLQGVLAKDLHLTLHHFMTI